MILSGDFYYLVDQARDLLLTKSVVIDHKITLIGARAGLGGLFHGPLWIYMISPFFLLAKGNPFWTLAPLFELVSLGTVIVGFFVGLKLYGKWTGLLFALILSISSTLVTTVPFTTNAQLLPMIFLLYLYSIIKFIRKDEKYFAAALIFAGLGFQFESAFAILFIPLTVVALVLRQKLPEIKFILIGLGGAFAAVSTFILFDLRHQFLMTKSFIRLFTNPVKPLPGYEQYANIGFRLQDRISTLWTSIFTPLFTPSTLTNILLLIILGTGIYFLIKNILSKKFGIEDKEYLFILLSPLIIFGVYVFYPLPLWPHYLLPIAGLMTFILVLSMRKVFINQPLKILVGIFLLLSLLPALSFVKDNYIGDTNFTTNSDGSLKNQLQVVQWVVADAGSKDYGYFAYTPGILTYNMDYLMWWISYKNHLPAPSNLKHPITYLIMAPQPTGDLHAHDYWKTHIVRTNGKVILTKVFASGISVEKLQIDPSEQPADPNYYQNLIFR